jgi:hypothetical protein
MDLYLRDTEFECRREHSFFHGISQCVRSRKPRLMAVGIRCADHVTPSARKSWHYFADSGGRSVGIVRLRTKATEFFFLFISQCVEAYTRISPGLRHDLVLSDPFQFVINTSC